MNPERGECGYHLARLHSVRDTERIRGNDASPSLISCQLLFHVVTNKAICDHVLGKLL